MAIIFLERPDPIQYPKSDSQQGRIKDSEKDDSRICRSEEFMRLSQRCQVETVVPLQHKFIVLGQQIDLRFRESIPMEPSAFLPSAFLPSAFSEDVF